MSLHDLRLAMKLSKAFKMHLAYLEELGTEMAERGAETADQDAKTMISRLEEHKKTCSGCSVSRIAELAASLKNRRGGD